MPAVWRAHWYRGGQAFETQDLPEVGSGPLVVCSLISSAFLLCSRYVALEICLFRVLRAFLEGFGVVVRVCVVLAHCVACGAFVYVSG